MRSWGSDWGLGWQVCQAAPVSVRKWDWVRLVIHIRSTGGLGFGLGGRGLGLHVAEEKDRAEGALVHAMETGFVAVDKSQLGRGGEFAEGGGGAGTVTGIRVLIQLDN